MLIQFPSYVSAELCVQISKDAVMVLDKVTRDVKEVQPLGFELEDCELLRHDLSTKVCANGRRYFQVGSRVYELVEMR